MGEFQVGQVIELNDGRRGRIRYVGSFHLKPGEWIGVELEDESGKNDGEVQGKRYFQCQTGHGMFLQASGISEIVEKALPVTKPAAAKRLSTASAGGAAKSGMRATNLGKSAVTSSTAGISTATTAAKRQSIVEASRARKTINSASPTPISRTTVRTTAAAVKPPLRAGAPAASAGSLSTSRPVLSSSTSSTTNAAARRTSLLGRSGNLANSVSTSARQARTSTVGSATFSGANSVAKQPISKLEASKKVAQRTAALQSSRNATIVSKLSLNDAEPQTDDDDEDINDDQTAKSDDELRKEEGDEQVDLVPGTSGSTSKRQLSISSNKAARNLNGTREPPSAGLSRPTSNQLSAQSQKIQELETTKRVLEKQIFESRDRLKEMDSLKAEKERFENIIQKLEAKLKPQVEEISRLRKDLKEKMSELDRFETQGSEFEETMELATLDREMAEELAETYKIELDALKRQHEELALEADILKAENEDLGREMSPEERNSMGFAQLEKSNERLRDALIRLRDMTQDTEAGLKDRIKDLEEEVDENAKYKSHYEETQVGLSQTETLVEDLKQQLEAAQGSDDMIEELTEKNIQHTEKITELNSTVQYLQELSELNEQLIADHEQNVSGMQEEIDYRDSMLLETAKKSSEQDQVIEELDYNIGRYRDLVKDLNADLEELRASQHITEAEHSELSTRSKAMMDLNLRLQQSATKTQVKVIENELKRLEAQEASDQLVIAQRFLPTSYLQHNDSIATFLCFKRVHFKTGMLHVFLKERTNNDTTSGQENDVFAACELLDKLTWISTICQRFIRLIISCSLDVWEQMSSTSYDLEPVERTLNSWIDALKKDEFRENIRVSELQRTVSVLEHLGERFFGDGLNGYAEQVNLKALIMQSQLGGAINSLLHITSIAKARVTIPSDADEVDEQDIETFNNRAENLISQIRSVKVVGEKSLQHLEELNMRNLTLELDTQATIETASSLVSSFAAVCYKAGMDIATIVNDDTRLESLSYKHLALAVSLPGGLPFSAISTQLNAVSNAVQSFNELTTSISSTVEFDTLPSADNLNIDGTPWSQLAAQLRAQNEASADRDAEVARLNDTLSERSTALAMKDKQISELQVSIEVLQKRADDGAKAISKARDFEIELEALVKKRETLEEQAMKKEEEIRQLKAENENWKASGTVPGDGDGSAALDQASLVRAMEDVEEGGYVPARVSHQLEIMRAELKATRSVVRQLRQTSISANLCGGMSDGILEPLNTERLSDTPQEHNTAGDSAAYKALRDLRKFINASSNHPVKLKQRDKDERLKWRPAHHRLNWQVGTKLEEWETWRENVTALAKHEERQSTRAEKLAMKTAPGPQKSSAAVLARLALRPQHILAGKDELPASDVKIFDPSQWSRLGSRIGFAY